MITNEDYNRFIEIHKEISKNIMDYLENMAKTPFDFYFYPLGTMTIGICYCGQDDVQHIIEVPSEILTDKKKLRKYIDERENSIINE